MQLNDLRKDMKFNGEMHKLIDTLKNVAAQQYHMMEKDKVRFDAFMDAFAGFFRVVDLVRVRNPLVHAGSDTLGLVVVTSDSGFMGGLNQAVLRAAFETQGLRGHDKVELMVIGDKGAGLLTQEGRRFEAFRGIQQGALYEQAVEVRDRIVAHVLSGRVGKVVVAYPAALSFSAQTVRVTPLLPCSDLFDREAESDVSRRTRGERLVAEARRVIVESSFGDIAQYLAGMWVAAKLYQIFEDSKLAEFSARAMHLEGSVQKLESEGKRLRHLCFKAAHERIDKGMRESFSATKQKRDHKRSAAA